MEAVLFGTAQVGGSLPGVSTQQRYVRLPAVKPAKLGGFNVKF